MTKENSYFTLLTNRININNIAYVDVIYKDKNKFGIYYSDGSVNMEFDNRSLCFDTEDDQYILNVHMHQNLSYE